MENFKIESGILLISEPYLEDPNFKRTVVLVVEHDEQGTIGFVLNKKTELSLDDVIENMPRFLSNLYLGGPVEQNTLHFIHSSSLSIPGSIEVASGLNWGGDFDTLIDLISVGKVDINEVRFFLGYSGWAKEQLLSEIENKAWILSRYSTESILKIDADELWQHILKNMGDEFRLIANYPENPQFN